MRERIEAGLLMLALVASGEAPPPVWFTDWMDRRSVAVMERFEAACVRRGLLYPEIETTESYVTTTPTGVFMVVWNRHKGHPLPYPQDPVRGEKIPNPSKGVTTP